MRFHLRAAALAAATIAAVPAFSAVPGPTVDGMAAAGEYGPATASVAYDPAAPTSNFGAPGPTARAGYDIYLKRWDDKLFGAIVETSAGTFAEPFANLYFDLDPITGSGGSEIVIEVGNKRGGIAGGPANIDLTGRIDFAHSQTGDGLRTFEFSIENSVFRDFITGIEAANYWAPGGYVDQVVRLNMSQSLTYSVAGGATYGAARLGTFNAAAIPEPASWALMLVGFGAVGYGMRRRRRLVARPAFA